MLPPAERYTGYTAYDYLEKGVDYREFTYAKQIGRVPEYAGLDLSDAQKERTQKLLAEETVISLHDHVQVFPENMDYLRDHIRQGREPTGYEGLSRSGITAVFDLQLYTRRLHAWRLAAGSESYWNQRIGAALLSSELSVPEFARIRLSPQLS